MGDLVRTDVPSAYETDFYSWSAEQAALLRALPRSANALDIDNIAEEIEDLGRNALHAVESLCERIIQHLLKLDYSDLDYPRAHWEREIVGFRIELDRRLTATLRSRIASSFEKRYANGRKLAEADLKAELPAVAEALPTRSPYSLNDVLGIGDRPD